MNKNLTLKKILAGFFVLMAVLLVLSLAGLAQVASLQAEVSAANAGRYRSYLLADELRELGLDAEARRSTARPGALGLDERDQLALGLGIALVVALRHRQAGMRGEFLDVSETPADLRYAACSTRNEGTTSRVRRTAVHLQRRIQSMEPQAHGGG